MYNASLSSRMSWFKQQSWSEVLSSKFGAAAEVEVSKGAGGDGFIGIGDTNRMSHNSIKWGVVQAQAPKRSDWNNERKVCRNCGFMFLTSLGKDASFCTVDCRANAKYMKRVTRGVNQLKQYQKSRGKYQTQNAGNHAEACKQIRPPVISSTSNASDVAQSNPVLLTSSMEGAHVGQSNRTF